MEADGRVIRRGGGRWEGSLEEGLDDGGKADRFETEGGLDKGRER